MASSSSASSSSTSSSSSSSGPLASFPQVDLDDRSFSFEKLSRSSTPCLSVSSSPSSSALRSRSSSVSSNSSQINPSIPEVKRQTLEEFFNQSRDSPFLGLEKEGERAAIFNMIFGNTELIKDLNEAEKALREVNVIANKLTGKSKRRLLDILSRIRVLKQRSLSFAVLVESETSFFKRQLEKKQRSNVSIPWQRLSNFQQQGKKAVEDCTSIVNECYELFRSIDILEGKVGELKVSNESLWDRLKTVLIHNALLAVVGAVVAVALIPVTCGGSVVLPAVVAGVTIASMSLRAAPLVASAYACHGLNRDKLEELSTALKQMREDVNGIKQTANNTEAAWTILQRQLTADLDSLDQTEMDCLIATCTSLENAARELYQAANK